MTVATNSSVLYRCNNSKPKILTSTYNTLSYISEVSSKVVKFGNNITSTVIYNVLGVADVDNRILIDTLEFEGKKIIFKEMFYFEYKVEDEACFYDNVSLNIYCYGKNKNELLNNFAENLVVSWKLYVDCDVSELYDDALKFRTVLSSLIEVI